MRRLCLFLLAGSCAAAELILPSKAFDRTEPVTIVYRTQPQVTGSGTLHIQWTDAYHRLVEDRTLPVTLTEESELRFSLDLRRALTIENKLEVHLSLQGQNLKGEADNREENASAEFIASPDADAWRDYQIIEWQSGSAERFRVLQELGVNAGRSGERSTSLPAALLEDNLRWFVENIATDFYSEYHRARRDRPHDWSLLQAQKLYESDPSSREGLKRHPSFNDPAWIAKIHDRAVETARAYAPYRPLYYNLADESGIAELASFWDFDFSDHSLDAMRAWLKDRYGTLAALNAQWGTAFTDWNLVTPETTREAMRRTDENYSSWSDFKEWMDIAYAAALKMGADAIHSVDPAANVAIEGAQMPGWGGYDYARLASVLDLMEPYDIGDNIEILHTLNPRVKFVTTSFDTGPLEKHRVWYELLHGASGQIIWDPDQKLVGADDTIGPRGREVAPYWNELRNGVAAVIMNSRPEYAPIAIHYSQPSMRIEWMREQRPKGDAWMNRKSSTERRDSDFLRDRDSWCRLMEDLGLSYKFVSYGGVENGDLEKDGYRVLILPRSSALSAEEAAAIRQFAETGGLVLSDGEPGRYDQHDRRLKRPQLEGLENMVAVSAFGYDRDRVLGAGEPLREHVRKLMSEANLRPSFAVLDASGKPATTIRSYVFRNGGVRILGLLNNPPIEQDELGPLKIQSQKQFEKTNRVRLVISEPAYAYDLRNRKSLGPYEPALIALAPSALPKWRVRIPKRVRRGETAVVSIVFDESSPVETDVLHVEIRNPSGELARFFSGNVLTRDNAATKPLPIAWNDPAGRWSVFVKDVLSGQQTQASFEVY